MENYYIAVSKPFLRVRVRVRYRVRDGVRVRDRANLLGTGLGLIQLDLWGMVRIRANHNPNPSPKKRLTDNDVTVLQNWALNSPDLNGMENCWMIVKRKVAAHRPKLEIYLVEVLWHVWTSEITSEYCKTQVNSMPNLIKAVLDHEEYSTKY